MILKVLRTKLNLAIISVVILGSASVARADFMGMFNAANSASINIAGTTAVNSAIRNSAKSRRRRTSPKAIAVHRQQGSLAYQPSSALSEQLRNRFWDQIKADNPQATSEIDTQLRYQDVIGKFNQNVAPYGLRSDNVGDTFTAYWIIMWVVVNRESIPSLDKVKIARTQIGEAILESGFVAQNDNARKQTVSEMLIYETMMALSMNNQIRKTGTPSQINALSDQAHQNMLKQGIDMRSIQLTPTGFTIR